MLPLCGMMIGPPFERLYAVEPVGVVTIKTIRLIGDEEFAIHLRADGNHRSIITLQHGNIVEGERIASQNAALSLT